MSNIHPDVQAALDAARSLRHRIADMRERIDEIRARRPSPNGLIIPEVDAMGRLTSLYLTPGTAARCTGDELASEIMAAIRESTVDAAHQYRHIMETSLTDTDDVNDMEDTADAASTGSAEDTDDADEEMSPDAEGRETTRRASEPVS